jgi:hypothetical protein
MAVMVEGRTIGVVLAIGEDLEVDEVVVPDTDHDGRPDLALASALIEHVVNNATDGYWFDGKASPSVFEVKIA